MKHSRNVSFLAVIVGFSLFASSQIRGFEGNALLTKEDLAYQENDRQRGPALSSALNDPRPWATYNQWMCFDTSQVRVESVGIKFDAEWKPWPQMTVNTLGQTFDFSPETDRELDTEIILKSWGKLLVGAREVCLYAAFLQYLDTEEQDSPVSLWVLEDVKTETEYWHVDDAIKDRTTLSEIDGEETIDDSN